MRSDPATNPARQFLGTVKTRLHTSVAALVVVAAGVSTAQAQVIAQWDFNTFTTVNQIVPGPVAADQTAAGVTVGDLTRGAGLSQFETKSFSSQPVLRFVNSVGATTEAAAVSGNVYAEFSLTPTAGNKLDLTTLTLDAWSASSTASRSFFVRYSPDPTFAFSSTLIPATSAPSSGSSPAAVSGNINITDLTSAIYFRIYGFDPGSGSPNRGLQYDNITVSGSVSPIPEPSTYALMGGLGLVGFAGYRRWRAGAR